MSNTIFNVILILLVFVPLIYLMFFTNKGEKIDQAVINYANENGISQEKNLKLTSATIILDKTKNAVLYYSDLFHKKEIITLDNLIKSEVKKEYQSNKIHGKESTHLTAVSLKLIKKGNETISLPIIDVSLNAQFGDDILKIQNFSKQLEDIATVG